MEESYAESSKNVVFHGKLLETRGTDMSLDRRIEEDGSVNYSTWNVDGGLKKKRGRKRVTEVMHIINPQDKPALELDAEDDGIRGASRVFVDDHGSDMHFDWPIYSKVAIRDLDAAIIVMSDGRSVAIDRICSSAPQEYTETGIFIVDVRQLNSLSSLLSDGLGLWGMPHSSYTYYRSNGEKVSEDDLNWITKIVCDRYKHPGTESYGHFTKCVYSGISPSGKSSPIVVISYEWQGKPHPILIQGQPHPLHYSIKNPSGRQQLNLPHYQQYTSEPCEKIFSQFPMDFDGVSRILLGSLSVESDRICESVPDSFDGTGTFLVNIEKAGGEKVLHTAGGGRWSRPSGASRFFRSEVESGHWIRVDKGRGSDGEDDWDVQIISKRYESESHPGLTRKIFLVREKREDVEAAHSSLAVITFSWKESKGSNELHTIEGEMGGRKRRSFQLETDVGDLSYSELRRLTLRKESQNYERLGGLLTRLETIANRYGEIMQICGNEGVEVEMVNMEEGEEMSWNKRIEAERDIKVMNSGGLIEDRGSN